MLRPTMLLWLPLALTLGCGGAGSNDGGAGSNDGGAGNEPADELAGIIAEIEDLSDRARPFLEQQAAELAAAEEAYNNAPGRRIDAEKRRLSVERYQLQNRYRNPQRTLENNLRALERLRTAYEDDTWDLLTMGMVSPRSFLIDHRRTVERQLIRLEAGCGAEAPIPSNDDCEVE